MQVRRDPAPSPLSPSSAGFCALVEISAIRKRGYGLGSQREAKGRAGTRQMANTVQVLGQVAARAPKPEVTPCLELSPCCCARVPRLSRPRRPLAAVCACAVVCGGPPFLPLSPSHAGFENRAVGAGVGTRCRTCACVSPSPPPSPLLPRPRATHSFGSACAVPRAACSVRSRGDTALISRLIAPASVARHPVLVPFPFPTVRRITHACIFVCARAVATPRPSACRCVAPMSRIKLKSPAGEVAVVDLAGVTGAIPCSVLLCLISTPLALQRGVLSCQRPGADVCLCAVRQMSPPSAPLYVLVSPPCPLATIASLALSCPPSSCSPPPSC